jgi:hypothetical protein
MARDEPHRRPAREIAQPALYRERKLDPAGPAADDRDARRAAARLRISKERVEPLEEPVHRLHRHPDFTCAGDREVGAGADIERDEIIADRSVPGAKHDPIYAIEPVGFGMDQPRAGRTDKTGEVDVAFGARVHPGDETGQHARIRRLEVARDERQPNARHRLEPKALEHIDMRVPAADEDEFLRHHASPPCLAGRLRAR